MAKSVDISGSVVGITAVYLTKVLDECQGLSSFEELSS
jgi:hypothetical protein